MRIHTMIESVNEKIINQLEITGGSKEEYRVLVNVAIL